MNWLRECICFVLLLGLFCVVSPFILVCVFWEWLLKGGE